MKGRGEVRLTGVGKSFGETSVLREVDLDIRPGEFFSLLGPSGSGKTTTLRIIAGLETATEGHVFLDGTDATLLPPGDRDVAMVFQSYALYPHMTVAENIGFPLKMIKTPASEIAPLVKGLRRPSRCFKPFHPSLPLRQRASWWVAVNSLMSPM